MTTPPAKPDDAASPYEQHRQRMAAKSRERAAYGQEIGPLPAVADPARRLRCRDSVDQFELTYFPARFPLPFSTGHLAMSERLEHCVRHGGLASIAFMRGGGKTTLAEVKVIKAILYGFRRFVVLLQATERLAGRSLRKIRRELESNELLLADFPEVCYPIHKLGRSAGRQRGQKLDGLPTQMEWTAEGVILPTVARSPASGAVIHVAGVTGAVKGLSMIGPAGDILRPDLVLIDDAQTRDSAKSPTQTADREAVICDDVLALAGPMQTIAAINLCTPIYENDLSERLLDSEKHPEWNGLRTAMLPKFPDRMDLWDQYAELRRLEGQPAATAFYRERAAEMDAGAVVTWPERVKAGPYEATTGLELAMILYYQNPRAFWAEYQCQPEARDLGADAKELQPDLVAGRFSGYERYVVPAESTRLTVFIDCGIYLHWYLVAAWNEHFGGAVVDYGCWPRQARAFFAASDARPTLAAKYPGMTGPQLVFAGLTDLAAEVLGRAYYRQGGAEVRPDVCLIDSGDETDAVYQWVRQAPRFGFPVHPSKGFGRTLTARGVAEWARRDGERVGHHWRMTSGQKDRLKSVQFDTDVWKSLVHGMLTTPPGGKTGVTLFGKAASAHEMISHHFAAEYSTPVAVRGVTFDKWAERPDRPDNHLWDCMVGAAAAASVAGLAWSATGEPEPRKPRAPRKSWSDIQREKAGGR